jgi:hypothetical protein
MDARFAMAPAVARTMAIIRAARIIINTRRAPGGLEINKTITD